MTKQITIFYLQISFFRRRKRTMFSVLVIISMAVVESAFGKDCPIVNTFSGKVRGQTRSVRVSLLEEPKLICTYLGIPYAKPPVGNLRFKKPEPAEAWEGIFKADKFPAGCVQHSSYPYPWFDQEPGNKEDCLFLNIYQPRRQRNDKPSPVIFVIHGGYYIGGSNKQDFYNGEYYAADWGDYKHNFRGAMVVAINYRLGAFGFLTTNIEEAPGNVGMYDILLALKWVKENAAAFNGDPNKITLIGSGAGSVVVSLFCVSPLTGGMFSAAILNGGTFVSTKKNKREANLQLSASLAQAVNCSKSEEYFRSNPKGVVTCLQGVDANKLAETLNSLNPGALSLFNPEYDGKLFPRDPVQALKDGKFHDVAIFVVVSATEGSLTLTNKYPEDFGRFGEKIGYLGINTTFATSILKDTFKSYPEPGEITRYFLHDIPFNEEQTNWQRTVRAVGDDTTYCPAVYFAEKYGDKHGRVYFLEFYFQPPTITLWAKMMESVHFNDAPYMLSSILARYFEEGGYNFRLNDTQKDAALQMRKYNLDIVVYGHETDKTWKAVKFGSKNHGRNVIGDTDRTFKSGVNIKYDMYGCDYLRKFQGF